MPQQPSEEELMMLMMQAEGGAPQSEAPPGDPSMDPMMAMMGGDPSMMGAPPPPPQDPMAMGVDPMMQMMQMDPSMMMDPANQPIPEEEEDTHQELVNLAEYIEEEELTKIATTVIEDYETDEESRKEWLDMHASWLKLYYQKDKPINPPWPGSSEESIPILLEGCNQFHSRAYKAFFAKPNFVSAFPIGKIDKVATDRSERVGRYMSWQLEINDTSYKRNKDRLLRALPLHGSFFTKVYRDPIKNRNVVENVRPVDLVVPYGNYPCDIDQLERKTQIVWKSLRECKYLKSIEYFSNDCESFTGQMANPIQDVVDQAIGIKDPGMVKGKPAKILEQHRFLDLDGDDIEEPYIVWVDAQSRKVLRIAIRYDVDGMGEPLSNKDPIEFFTHYTYLENPDGFYGLGLGHLTGSMNSAVNKMLRQCIDAATLQNIRTGFISRMASMRKGNIEIEYGKLITLDGVMEDIRKAILFMDHPGPSNALVSLMQLLIERADRINMVTDMLTGQPDKVYQPTTAMAQIEQALTQFSAVQVRVYAALEEELKKLYRLNKLYVGQTEYYAINDAMGMQAGFVAKADFQEDLQIRPAIDIANATETQKIQRGQTTFQFAMQNPLIAQSPPHLYEASKRFLESIGETDIDLLLPRPEEAQQKEQQMMGQQQQMMQAQQAMMQQEQQMKMAELDLKSKDLMIKTQKAQGDMMLKDKTTAEANELVKMDLELKQQEIDIKRMKAQADIGNKVVDKRIKAEEIKRVGHLERMVEAARIDTDDAKHDLEKAKLAIDAKDRSTKNILTKTKIAADLEAKITKQRQSTAKEPVNR